MMVGRELSAVFPKSVVEPGDVVLELEGLGCRASGRARRVAVEFAPVRFVGLAGLVGAGRTELARVVFGLTPADSGVIRLRGQARDDRLAGARRRAWGSPMSPKTVGGMA